MSTLSDIIQREKEYLNLRRKHLGTDAGNPGMDDMIGIASSGGGIRSATINLGFLRVLTQYGILQLADYHSSVSGGGYTSSFVQATVRQQGSFDKVFSAEQTESLRRDSSDYMKTGDTLGLITLIFGYLTSLLFSYINPAILLATIYSLFFIFSEFLNATVPFWSFAGNDVLLYLFLGALSLHGLAVILFRESFFLPKIFIRLEILLIGIFLLANWVNYLAHLRSKPYNVDHIWNYLLIVALLLLLGYFTTPSAFSFGRYYQKQLSDAFLRFGGRFSSIKLHEMVKTNSDTGNEHLLAPYPLFNTCVNFNPSGNDKQNAGAYSDYFLLSPLHVGSKITGYIPTDTLKEYRNMSMSKAVGISAAAVNAGMGTYSNSFTNLIITIFNAGLGEWMPNPIHNKRSPISWGPLYFLNSLFSRQTKESRMVNISDGGHIENLGVFELLRRKCKLIICMDAGEDRRYNFDDLRNLMRRSLNELGLEIIFRNDERPEDNIRPNFLGFSKKRFAIADVYRCWEIVDAPEAPDGRKIINYSEQERKVVGPVSTLVYVKSSIRQPQGMPDLSSVDNLQNATYKHKLYDQRFPHDPTSDQSFSLVQWEAYHQLGRFLAAEMLGINYPEWNQGEKVASRAALIQYFGSANPQPLFPLPSANPDEFESTQSAPPAPLSTDPPTEYKL